MPQTLTVEVTTNADNEEWRVVSNGSTDMTVPLGKTMVLASASVGGVTIHLPSATGDMKDRMIAVKKTDGTGNSVIVDPNGSETIDGVATNTLAAQYETVMAVSDGANWHTIQ